MTNWQAPQQPPQGYWPPQPPVGAMPPSGSWVAPGAAGGYQTPPPRRSRRALVAVAVGAVMAITAASAAVAVSGPSVSGSVSASATERLRGPEQSWGYGSQPPSYPYDDGSSGSSGSQSSPYRSGGTTTTGQATAAQSVGVVDINTVLDYGSAEAAGTGMILTANGEILTNNHVVEGATSISVTVVSTGKSYNATVVGTDPTDDVAVLQLSGASGLSTAKLGDSSSVQVGDSVTAVGNAGGTGGTPSAATGSVTALNQTITASDQNGSNAETLTGMIETNANVQAGDSGGPLYDASGTVIGMDTAASSSQASFRSTGYAIPIAKATAIADQIESGQASDTIHIGSSGFLGVQLQSADSFGASSGAAIVGVVDNSPAADAGLAAGDTITAINGTSVTSASALSSAIDQYKAGDQIPVSWVDSSGQSHTATVTLGVGPAD